MSVRTPPVPATRDLERLIEACDIVASEHAFQAYRLTELATPRTADETRHFAEMAAKYQAAHDQTRLLQSYTKKRVQRQAARGTLEQASLDQPDAVSRAGVATAYLDDEEAPV